MTAASNTNELSNNTRTAVSLAFGLGASGLLMLLFSFGPHAWSSITNWFSYATHYSVTHPGKLAQYHLLAMFVALAAIAFLREWKTQASSVLQATLYGLMQFELFWVIATTQASVSTNDIRNTSFLLMFVVATYAINAAFIWLFYSTYLEVESPTEEYKYNRSWSPYGMTKQLAGVPSVFLLIFDGTLTNFALMLGLWLMLAVMPNDGSQKPVPAESEAGAKAAEAEPQENGINLSKG